VLCDALFSGELPVASGLCAGVGFVICLLSVLCGVASGLGEEFPSEVCGEDGGAGGCMGGMGCGGMAQGCGGCDIMGSFSQ
jgi:hypothetical protein